MGSTVFAVTLATLSQLSLASRPMITLMEHSNGFINQIKSFSQPPQHENRLRCSQPCQRLPNMVKLQPILMRYGVNKNIVDLIETNDGNSYGEIDIGRCAGSCRAVESESIRPGQLSCVAESYDDLKTKLRIENELMEGPLIEKLVIKSCVCSTVHICN